MEATKRADILKLVTILLIWLLLPLPVQAQRYSFHNLNVDDGLIQSQAMCLTQDKTGNLWVGTLGGLSRYDGKTFTNYNVRNGLTSNTVSALAADRYGNIWVGTRTGLMRFNGSKFEPYNMQRLVEHPLDISQQINIVNDTVWWRAMGDVYYVTSGKIKYLVTPGPEGRISALMAEPGNLWIAKSDTIYHLEQNKWTTLTTELLEAHDNLTITRIYRTKDNTLLVGTNAGLYYVLHNKLVPFIANGFPLNFVSVRSITQDKNGDTWLATRSGVVRLVGHTIEFYNKHNGLSDNPFHDIFTDVEGNIWMASDGQGIFRFSGTLFTGLDETMGLPSAQIVGIASNKRDSLFLGTYEAGLFVFKDGKITERKFPTTPSPSITALCYTHDQRLWIATRDKGLFEYDHEIFRQYSSPQKGFPSNAIFCLYEDPQQRLWVGFSNGVMCYDHDTFRTIQVKNERAVSFVSIGNDSVLIATEKKDLLLYHDGQVTDFVTGTVADSSTVECFLLLGRNLWLGTNDNGAIRYNMDSKRTLVVNKTNGLRSDFIYNIIDDNAGNIWVGTGFGIHKIVVDANGVPQVTFYGKEQGVTGMESNINAVVKQKDGSIWFGTTNGAIQYHPNSFTVYAAPTSIVLQSVKLVGESTIDRSFYDSSDQLYGIPYHLKLPFKKNNISFTFQAITLSGAEQVQYRYRLEGTEGPWSEWSTSNAVTYSSLPSGNYVFRAQCMGSDGAETHPELAYSFEIITPYHKTWWFRLCILLFCILCGILLQSIFSRRNQRRQRLRAKLRAEEQAKIRMRTAEDFHDEIGNKLTRINVLTNVLKSKINPVNPEVTRLLTQIEENTSLLYGGTRDILWSLKPSNDNLFEILLRINDFGGELFSETNVHFSVTGITEKLRNYRLPMDMSRNLIMIFKEALNNALKYARAQHITLEITLKHRDVLHLLLKDDGIGFDTKLIKKGNGINNMMVRAGRINGRLYLDSHRGKGTIISLTFRVPKNKL